MRRLAAAARQYASYHSPRDSLIGKLIQESRLVVNEKDQHHLIEKTVDAHLWALAAKFCRNFWTSVPSHTLLKQVVSGLTLYDPRLTPLHMRTIGLLYERYPDQLSLDSNDKARLIESAMNYASSPDAVAGSEIVERAFRLSVTAPGGPIPIWTLHSLLQQCTKLWLFNCIGSVWGYLRAEWPTQCVEYTPLITKLMIACSQTRRQRAIAKEIALTLMDRVSSDPNVALAVAKVALKLRNTTLFSDLRNRVKDPTRPVLGIMLLWYLDHGDAQNMRRTLDKIGSLTSREAAAVVRILASKDLEHAEEFLQTTQISSPDLGKAYFELLNAAIDQADAKRVGIYREKCKKNGATLSVLLKWELQQHGFEAARELYQRWKHPISSKSHAVCLRMLSQATQKESEQEWVLSEASLVGVPTRPLENVMSSYHKI